MSKTEIKYGILPDGEYGTVKFLDSGEVEVFQAHKVFGRGPWIFAPEQVTIVSKSYLDGYIQVGLGK